MTVPNGQLPVQERARAHAEQVLGPQTAKRLAPFRDGVLYVKAGGGARFLAWLVDVVVLVLGMGVGVVIVGGKAAWAMLVRLLMPLLVIGTIIGTLAAGGGGATPARARRR
ncbi:hypothetical protein [Actinophytocola algeriensis]|uniref:RDD family protein n=1 Tax=Actinophytocola algeriensis TaxID=1768010 RepID=A0A7W7QFR2_9PSEU|nr:hypothetical protein [Actinophytocola algeriensis]MBB4912816.1 hypothetical protein [Actinophytocola algeriensis]MBE1474150.1 hypothetical protein [Actinophytocola algeriensis]